MKATALLVIALGAPPFSAGAQAEPRWRSLDVSRQLRDAAPLHRYDAEQRSAVLGLETRSANTRVSSSGRSESGELRLLLPRAVPLDLDLEFGGAEASLELGGLTLQSVRLECGATDATLNFTTPNRAHMRELVVDVGAASFTALHLGNANADEVRVRGGMGAVDLDFSGTWQRDLSVVTRVGIGKTTLRVPDDVGVRQIGRASCRERV